MGSFSWSVKVTRSTKKKKRNKTLSMKPLIFILQIVLLVICLKDLVNAVEGESKTRDDLIAVNKRSAMLLDRLMYNLKEIMKKLPKDPSEDDLTDGMKFDRRAYRYVRGKVYTKCYMNAVSCF